MCIRDSLNYREYLIATGAVFLALALGILIGVSFGDGILAANQRNVMELMEDLSLIHIWLPLKRTTSSRSPRTYRKGRRKLT